LGERPDLDFAGPAMAAVAAVVYLLGGIVALLPHPSRTDLVGGAAPGETLDPCDRTMMAPWCRILSWGLGLWSWSSASGTSGRQGVCVEASVATMVVSSDIGDVALVAVVGSSSTWVCLGLIVVVKSKLRWWVLVAYDDWRQEVCSVIFRGTSLA
jgi:hypothetical protein